ncbi:MAG TPA: PKD domain-containing protein, partial [Flavisolibacter sp.]|nr:PKD domain-containing protein [Flavisolibacter sp.]
MRPSSASQIHTLRFININENNFVGGGMDPMASDVGLWVMASGRLDVVGTEKTSWTRVTDTVAAGSASFTLKETPRGWAAGDEIVLVPTSKPPTDTLVWDDASRSHKDLFRHNFEQRKIGSVSGTSVAVTSAFSYNTHQKVTSPDGPSWTAEVLNLNRNVRIEGTASGRTHIFIRSTVPQTLQNAALRYMGPRKDQDGNGRTDMIAGRYAIHFHHCFDGSVGSQVTGNIVYECGNHSYVPHVSHGINMSNNVAYDCLEIAFWWDFGHLTHNATWNNNLIALNLYVPGSKDMAGSETGVLFTGGGMLLGIGDDNVAIGNTVVYAGVGDPSGKGGFIWEANNEGIWVFENNLAHSNHIGIRVWQNTVRNHTVFNQDCYNNVRHLFHGAYGNAYTYRACHFYDGEIEVKASSANSSGVRFENVKFHQAGKYPHCVIITRSAIPSIDKVEDFFINCSFKGYTTSAIRNEAGGVIMDGKLLNERKGVAMIMCDFDGGQPWSFRYEGSDPQYITNPTGWFRIQPKAGQSQLIVRGTGSSPVITNIPAFFPTLVGTGKGLKGEYFSDAGFSNKVAERIDSVIMFSEWYGDGPERYSLPIGVHHKITGTQHSTRWTGKVQAQYTEAYTFRIQGAGGYRIWIDGAMVLDKWQEKYDDSDVFISSPVQLTAGKFHDIKVEYFSSGGRTNAQLFWKSPSMEQEVLVPQSQLYAEAITGGGTPVETTNKVPVANAGADQSITLPTNSVNLNGSLSSDPDGIISSYKWAKVSGPSQFTLGNANAASTTLSNLAVGIYTFRLTVTDSKGATATDDVVIAVNDAANKAPVAHAGSDKTVVLPTSSTTLSGSASSDPDGTIASYLWTKVSGPAQGTITSPSSVNTTVTGLVLGTYTFRLQVKDNKGALSTDDVVIKVTNTVNKGPVANAGADQLITLPISTLTLVGSASSDPDGKIVSYLWTKVSGPSQFTLSSASAVTPLLS